MYNYVKYDHGKFANWIFNVTLKGAIFLSKHMWLYWILQFTWGIVYNVIGGFIALFCLIFKGKASLYHGHYIIMFGDNWGGLECGCGAIVANNMGDNWTEHIKNHESGHNFQNAIWGPIAIFMMNIPSAVRYWCQEINSRRGHHEKNKPYDSAFFEDSASVVGEYLYGSLKGRDVKELLK